MRIEKIEGPYKKGLCWPNCTWFKCVKNVLREKENDLWCDWLEQSCVGPSCAYASCVRNQLLPENRCGLAVKRITKDIVQPTDFKINVKLKGRAAGSIDMDDLV